MLHFNNVVKPSCLLNSYLNSNLFTQKSTCQIRVLTHQKDYEGRRQSGNYRLALYSYFTKRALLLQIKECTHLDFERKIWYQK